MINKVYICTHLCHIYVHHLVAFEISYKQNSYIKKYLYNKVFTFHMPSLIVFTLLSHKLDESRYQSLSISPDAIKANQRKVYLEQKKIHSKKYIWVMFAFLYIHIYEKKYRESIQRRAPQSESKQPNKSTAQPTKETMAFAVQIVVFFFPWRV